MAAGLLPELEKVYILCSQELLFPLYSSLGDLVFALLPFGSIGNAPLTIYTGMESEIIKTIGIQIFWNIILWTAGIKIFIKSEERMISFGG